MVKIIANPLGCTGTRFKVAGLKTAGGRAKSHSNTTSTSIYHMCGFDARIWLSQTIICNRAPTITLSHLHAVLCSRGGHLADARHGEARGRQARGVVRVLVLALVLVALVARLHAMQSSVGKCACIFCECTAIQACRVGNECSMWVRASARASGYSS